jgi:hypothetical protein
MCRREQQRWTRCCAGAGAFNGPRRCCSRSYQSARTHARRLCSRTTPRPSQVHRVLAPGATYFIVSYGVPGPPLAFHARAPPALLPFRPQTVRFRGCGGAGSPEVRLEHLRGSKQLTWAVQHQQIRKGRRPCTEHMLCLIVGGRPPNPRPAAAGAPFPGLGRIGKRGNGNRGFGGLPPHPPTPSRACPGGCTRDCPSLC